jgi:hypothetical protein
MLSVDDVLQADRVRVLEHVEQRQGLDGGPEPVRLLPEVEHHDRPAAGAPEDGGEPLRGELPARGGLELLQAGRQWLVPVEFGDVGRRAVVARQTRFVVRVDDQGRLVGAANAGDATAITKPAMSSDFAATRLMCLPSYLRADGVKPSVDVQHLAGRCREEIRQ